MLRTQPEKALRQGSSKDHVAVEKQQQRMTAREWEMHQLRQVTVVRCTISGWRPSRRKGMGISSFVRTRIPGMCLSKLMYVLETQAAVGKHGHGGALRRVKQE